MTDPKRLLDEAARQEEIVCQEEEIVCQEEEICAVIEALSDDVLDTLQSSGPLDKKGYVLNTGTLVCAINDALTGISRVGSYHSPTGVNEYKKAAYIATRISITKPIQVLPGYPRKQTNVNGLNNITLNSIFAIYALEALIGNVELYSRLRQDLLYAFNFRGQTNPDALAMLLEHALYQEVESH